MSRSELPPRRPPVHMPSAVLRSDAARPPVPRPSSFLRPHLPCPFLLLLFKATLFSKYFYLFCSVIRKENPGGSSLIPGRGPPSDVRVSQHVSLARSEGSGPCLPACPQPCHRRPLEIEAKEYYLCCVQSCCPTILKGGRGVGGSPRSAGGGWPRLPCCYFSMHQIVFMTPGEIYLILIFKRSGRRKKKVTHSISSKQKFF